MIQREMYMRQIRPFIGTDLIKVMTGMRRSGKSMMLELIKSELLHQGISKSQLISYNFEDLNSTHLQDAQALHDHIIQQATRINQKVYIFLDEIQEVNHWEKCINSLRVNLDCDIYITGSNAKLLSGELSTYLAGRYLEIVIYPFSFAEFSELYQTYDANLNNTQLFQQYLTTGGMPYLAQLQFNPEASKLYLHDLFNSVQLKDIILRNNIRDIDLLEKIIKYLIANIGTTFSATSIVKFLKNEQRKTSTETVLNYIKYAQDSFLLYSVKRQDLQGKQLLSTNEKYYIADHGIRQSIYGNNLRDINLTLENIVYMELRRRGYEVTVGKIGSQEIDFVCTKQDQKIYIQVAYLLATEETVRREFDAYQSVKDNYPKFVLSLDEIDFSQNGIHHYNIRDFLLKEKWI